MDVVEDWRQGENEVIGLRREEVFLQRPGAPGGDAADVMFTIAATAQKAGDKATASEYYKKLSGNAKYAAQATQQLGALQK